MFINQLGMVVMSIKCMSRTKTCWCFKRERCRNKIRYCKSTNLLSWTLRMRSYHSTIELTRYKETPITYYRRQWSVVYHSTMRRLYSMRILQLGLSTKCSSLIRNCFLLWYLDALEREVLESRVALTLESWFKTSTNKRNCYLAKVLLTLIWCLKGIPYLLATCFKILRTQNREATKIKSSTQDLMKFHARFMLSHKTLMIDNS